MASFSETYYTNGTVLGRCTNFLKYFLDPETKARRIVDISQRADIQFCQAFWELNESSEYEKNEKKNMEKLKINKSPRGRKVSVNQFNGFQRRYHDDVSGHCANGSADKSNDFRAP